MSSYMHLESLCGSILGLNKSIQSVAFINNKGRPLEKTSRPTFTKQFPDHLSELFCMQHVLQVSMGRDFDENYGPVNYHISERMHLTTLTFPVDEYVILVTTTKNVSPITLARRIADTINKYRNELCALKSGST